MEVKLHNYIMVAGICATGRGKVGKSKINVQLEIIGQESERYECPLVSPGESSEGKY